jgi:hypothetical protein
MNTFDILVKGASLTTKKGEDHGDDLGTTITATLVGDVINLVLTVDNNSANAVTFVYKADRLIK